MFTAPMISVETVWASTCVTQINRSTDQWTNERTNQPNVWWLFMLLLQTSMWCDEGVYSVRVPSAYLSRASLFPSTILSSTESKAVKISTTLSLSIMYRRGNCSTSLLASSCRNLWQSSKPWRHFLISLDLSSACETKKHMVRSFGIQLLPKSRCRILQPSDVPSATLSLWSVVLSAVVGLCLQDYMYLSLPRVVVRSGRWRSPGRKLGEHSG